MTNAHLIIPTGTQVVLRRVAFVRRRTLDDDCNDRNYILIS